MSPGGKLQLRNLRVRCIQQDCSVRFFRQFLGPIVYRSIRVAGAVCGRARQRFKQKERLCPSMGQFRDENSVLAIVIAMRILPHWRIVVLVLLFVLV